MAIPFVLVWFSIVEVNGGKIWKISRKGLLGSSSFVAQIFSFGAKPSSAFAFSAANF